MKDSFVWHKDQLKGEYQAVFDKIMLYGGVSFIDNALYEDMMMDLLDLFLTAQQDGKPVEKLVGGNVEKFCKNYFGHYTFRGDAMRLPARCVGWAWVIFCVELLSLLLVIGEIGSRGGVWKLETDIGPYLLGTLCGLAGSVLLAVAVKPFVFRIKGFTTGKYEALLLLILVGSLLLILWLDVFPVILAPVWLVLLISGGYLLCYYCVRAYRHRKKYGSFRKPRETEKISFWKKLSEDIERELPVQLKKRYEAENQKLVKKGKPERTPEEYMDTLRKELRFEKAANAVAMALVFAFCMGISVQEMVRESIAIGLFLMVVLLLCEIPIWRFFLKGIRGKSLKARLIARCDEAGVTVMDYADSQEKA